MIEKNILLTLTYLVGAGELFLAGYFWKTNSKNEIRKVMVALSFLLGIWVLTSALIAYREVTWWIGYAVQVIHVAGVLLLVTFLYLTLIYPYKSLIIDQLHKVLLYLPSIFFIYCIVFTNTIVESFQVSKNTEGIIIGGKLFILYNLYLLTLYIIALIVLGKKLRTFKGVNGRNVKIFFWAVFGGGLPGMLVDVVIPSFVQSANVNTLYGVVSTGLWVGATSFIVFKKK